MKNFVKLQRRDLRTCKMSVWQFPGAKYVLHPLLGIKFEDISGKPPQYDFPELNVFVYLRRTVGILR